MERKKGLAEAIAEIELELEETKIKLKQSEREKEILKARIEYLGYGFLNQEPYWPPSK